MIIKYVVRMGEKFIKEDSSYKLTSSLKFAKLFTNKNEAQKLHPNGIVENVYLDTKVLEKTVVKSIRQDELWIVEKICPLEGVSVYGPYFSQIEAYSVLDLIVKENDGSFLGKFKDNGHGVYANSLHEKLKVRRIQRVHTT